MDPGLGDRHSEAMAEDDFDEFLKSLGTEEEQSQEKPNPVPDDFRIPPRLVFQGDHPPKVTCPDCAEKGVASKVMMDLCGHNLGLIKCSNAECTYPMSQDCIRVVAIPNRAASLLEYPCDLASLKPVLSWNHEEETMALGMQTIEALVAVSSAVFPEGTLTLETTIAGQPGLLLHPSVVTEGKTVLYRWCPSCRLLGLRSRINLLPMDMSYNQVIPVCDMVGCNFPTDSSESPFSIEANKGELMEESALLLAMKSFLLEEEYALEFPLSDAAMKIEKILGIYCLKLPYNIVAYGGCLVYQWCPHCKVKGKSCHITIMEYKSEKTLALRCSRSPYCNYPKMPDAADEVFPVKERIEAGIKKHVIAYLQEFLQSDDGKDMVSFHDFVQGTENNHAEGTESDQEPTSNTSATEDFLDPDVRITTHYPGFFADPKVADVVEMEREPRAEKVGKKRGRGRPRKRIWPKKKSDQDDSST